MCLYVSSLSSHVLLSRPSTWGYLLLEVVTDSNDSLKKEKKSNPVVSNFLLPDHTLHTAAASSQLPIFQKPKSCFPGTGPRGKSPKGPGRDMGIGLLSAFSINRTRVLLFSQHGRATKAAQRLKLKLPRRVIPGFPLLSMQGGGPFFAIFLPDVQLGCSI